MSAQTSIQWTDRTWNPVRGCSRVSEGCRNCYAERQAWRFRDGAYKGLLTLHPSGEVRWNGSIRTVPDALKEPLRWKQAQRIFVNSMSDLFHEAVPDEFITSIFGTMVLASRHTFQVLTKRPRRMLEYMTATDRAREIAGEVHLLDEWPAANIWLGVSAENQETLEERIGPLCLTPAAVRFLSLEPLLGPIDFRGCGGIGYLKRGWKGEPAIPGIDWVIVGGESGPGARPCDVAWIRSIVEQCQAAGVPCFVKQVGRWIGGDHAGFFCVQRWLLSDGRVFVPPIIGPNTHTRPAEAVAFSLTDPKGGEMEDWPADLRVREFPKDKA